MLPKLKLQKSVCVISLNFGPRNEPKKQYFNTTKSGGARGHQQLIIQIERFNCWVRI